MSRGSCRSRDARSFVVPNSDSRLRSYYNIFRFDFHERAPRQITLRLANTFGDGKTRDASAYVIEVERSSFNNDQTKISLPKYGPTSNE